MNTRGIRGAITVDNNTKEDIKNATVELLNKMLEENNLNTKDISYAMFTMTNDLDADYPAKYARLECGFKFVPMMCSNELYIKDSLKMCLRVLLTINTNKTQEEIKHIYLKGASILRKDLK